MESFIPALGIAMMVLGLGLFLVAIGLVMYGLWLRYRVEPFQNRRGYDTAPDGQAEAELP